MSLILDALRKSEAERRRGQAPDLYAELPPLVPRTGTRRPAWPWWLAAALALLATLWMLRDVQSLAGATTAPAAAPVADRAATPAVSPPAVSPPATAPAATAVQAPVAMAAATPPVLPATSSVAAPTALGPIPVPAARDVMATMPASTAPTGPQPAPAAPLVEPTAPPPPVQAASASPPPAIASAASAPAPAPATAATGPAPLRLSDLSAGEREQLPALKISMHMWGPTPDQRFAIIDGARVGQGDRVGDAVVEEIGADSVVLNWHGQRLALPIR